MKFSKKSLKNLVLYAAILAFLGVFGIKAVFVSADVNTGTNIDPTIRTDPFYDSTGAVSTFWAWNDLIGWIDFHSPHNVNVKNTKITGWASSSAGEISLDCETSPNGNICGTQAGDYSVKNSGGVLSGWAWNDKIGWIAFCQGYQATYGADCLNGSVYQAGVYARNPDVPPSDFTNYAWNDVVGWISFGCAAKGTCGQVDYKVTTSWFATSTFGYLDSSTFDTEVPSGVKYNSIAWRGSMPSDIFGNTKVSFQLATSDNPNGPWNFFGPDGTIATSYDFNSGDLPSDSDLEHGRYFYAALGNPSFHAGHRYFRYRIWLYSNSNSTLSPSVDEVIINWSR